jgi:hypothetical protein
LEPRRPRESIATDRVRRRQPLSRARTKSCSSIVLSGLAEARSCGLSHWSDQTKSKRNHAGSQDHEVESLPIDVADRPDDQRQNGLGALSERVVWRFSVPSMVVTLGTLAISPNLHLILFRTQRWLCCTSDRRSCIHDPGKKMRVVLARLNRGRGHRSQAGRMPALNFTKSTKFRLRA